MTLLGSTGGSSGPSNSGITLTPDGQRVVPSSLRADGTARREIRVRPGYRPPEDVEVYKNRTVAAWKGRGSGGVPGAALVSDDEKKGGGSKSAKRKAAKKKAKEVGMEIEVKGIGGDKTKGGVGGGVKGFNDGSKGMADGTKEGVKGNQVEDGSKDQPAIDKEKVVKALKKKIRQANDLKVRGESGESLLPEEVEKVTKLGQLNHQLEALEIDD